MPVGGDSNTGVVAAMQCTGNCLQDCSFLMLGEGNSGAGAIACRTMVSMEV